MAKKKKKQRQPLGYVDGGQLGASAGALAGQLLIPIPGVGAGIGKIGGELIGDGIDALFNARKRRRERRRLEEQQKAANIVPPDLGEAQFKDGGLIATMVDGGKLKKLGGNAVKVDGPSHAKGGVQLPQFGAEVEGGETIASLGGLPFVFSDNLKVNSKDTFADAHESAVKKGVGEQHIIDLAKAQEIRKDPYGDTTLGAAGRIQGRKFQNGGLFEDVAPFLGPAFNIGAGLLGANKAPKFNPIDRRGTISALSGLPTRVNVQPQLSEQRQAFRTAASAPGSTPNATLAALSQTLQNRSRILANKENLETQREADKAKSIASANQQFEFVDNRNRILNDQQREQARTGNLGLIGRGLAQIGETVLGEKQDERLQQSNDFAIAASFASVTPEVREGFLKDLPPEQAERVRKILAKQGFTSLSSIGGLPSVSSGPNDGKSVVNFAQ